MSLQAVIFFSALSKSHVKWDSQNSTQKMWIIDSFGLVKCLEDVMKDLQYIVDNGIYDKKSDKILQVRVITSLGMDF